MAPPPGTEGHWQPPCYYMKGPKEPLPQPSPNAYEPTDPLVNRAAGFLPARDQDLASEQIRAKRGLIDLSPRIDSGSSKTLCGYTVLRRFLTSTMRHLGGWFSFGGALTREPAPVSSLSVLEASEVDGDFEPHCPWGPEDGPPRSRLETATHVSGASPLLPVLFALVHEMIRAYIPAFSCSSERGHRSCWQNQLNTSAGILHCSVFRALECAATSELSRWIGASELSQACVLRSSNNHDASCENQTIEGYGQWVQNNDVSLRRPAPCESRGITVNITGVSIVLGALWNGLTGQPPKYVEQAELREDAQRANPTRRTDDTNLQCLRTLCWGVIVVLALYGFLEGTRWLLNYMIDHGA